MLVLLSAALLLSASSAWSEMYDRGKEPPYAAALLVEAESGTILYEHDAHAPRSPASTQKLLLQLVNLDLGQLSTVFVLNILQALRVTLL